MLSKIAIAMVLVVLTACTTNPYTGEREASKKARGAGIGAAIGAVVGALSGDDADERRKRALATGGLLELVQRSRCRRRRRGFQRPGSQ